MLNKKNILISLLILVTAAGITLVIFSTEPTAKRGGAMKQTAMLVDVVTVHRDTFRPAIVATGTVQPAQDITLSPRVSGEIIKRSEAFTPGGFVQKGEVLLQIDPSDFRNDLQQQKSNLRQAIANLNIERGRQDVAQQDYQLVGDTLIDNLSEENQALVLRKPQLESVKADVEAARAAVNQAQLNLQRSTIRAPFDAHIINRNANVGSMVAPGENMGRLVGMDEYWVMVTVPQAKLPWLRFPEGKASKGAPVEIHNQTAWPQDQSRKGYLYKKIGALEGDTRMARLLVSVPDPLAQQADSAGKPALMIGSFVEARLQGEPIPNIVRLNRDYLRKNETVWVMKEGKLRIRQAHIVFKDHQYAYIKKGLQDGEKVVTTNISTVVDGSPLRTESAQQDSKD